MKPNHLVLDVECWRALWIGRHVVHSHVVRLRGGFKSYEPQEETEFSKASSVPAGYETFRADLEPMRCIWHDPGVPWSLGTQSCPCMDNLDNANESRRMRPSKYGLYERVYPVQLAPSSPNRFR